MFVDPLTSVDADTDGVTPRDIVTTDAGSPLHQHRNAASLPPAGRRPLNVDSVDSV